MNFDELYNYMLEQYNAKPLRYSTSSFKTILSKDNLKNHYKLYENYINNANDIIKTNNKYNDLSTIDIITSSYKNNDTKLFKNVSQIFNHEMFFNSISPDKQISIHYKIKTLIEDKYKTISNFKKKFVDKGNSLKSNGYIWLVLYKDKLSIIITEDENNALTSTKAFPLMCIDLWEHAYALDFKSKSKYLSSIFDYINWDYVKTKYEDANSQ